jgi:hypothetical protein
VKPKVTTRLALASTKAASQTGRVATGGKADQSVARSGSRGDLACEHLLEPLIVGDARHHGRIARQVARGQYATARHGRMLEFQGKARGLAARGAQSHGEHPAAIAPDVAEGAAHEDKAFRLVFEKPGGDLARFQRLGARGGREDGAVRRRVALKQL